IIPDQNLPNADAGSAETLTCAVTETLLDGSGSDTGQEFSYERYDENNVLSGTDLQLPVSLPGTYTLLVFNNLNDCSASDEVIVLQNTAEPIVEAGENQTLNCGDTELTLNGSASSGQNFTFEWRDENDEIISSSA